MALLFLLGGTVTLASAALFLTLFWQGRTLRRQQKRAHTAQLKLERELREEMFSLREALFASSLYPDVGTSAEEQRREIEAGRRFSEGVANIMGYAFDGAQREVSK
jgi:hypothetical protein